MSDVETPDHSDLWWGLPPRAVSDAVAALATTPKASHVSPIESDVLVSLSAAYPSIRRQVLESVVEDVAELIGDYREIGSVADDYRIARRVLGLDGEGEVEHG